MRSIFEFFATIWLAGVGGLLTAAALGLPRKRNPYFTESGEPQSW
jgi:hypothetical protein